MREKVWVFLLFACLSVIATWPAVAHLDTAIIGQETDAYVHLWNFNWVSTERPLANPEAFHTDRLFSPEGVSMTNQNVAWLHALAWLALRPMLGNFAAYTVVVVLGLAFNGYAGYLLGREVSGDVVPSLLAGLVMLLWPATMDHTNQPNMTTIGLVAMCLLYIHRLMTTGHSVEVLRLAFWGALVAISRVQLLLLAAPLVLPYAAFHLIRVDSSKRVARLGMCASAGLLAFLISTPVTLPYLSGFVDRNGGSSGPSVTYETQFATDLIFYVLPRLNGLLPAGAAQEAAHRMGLYVPFYAASLGWNVLILAGVGLVRGAARGPRAPVWALLAGFLLLAAAGPEPRLLGFTLSVKPYSDLYHALLMPIVREPRRFNLILSIPMSVLAALGLSTYRRRDVGPRVRAYATVLVFVLVALEFGRVPHPTLPVDTVPSWYVEISHDEEDYALAYIPFVRQWDETHMLQQLVHGKGLAHAHISRTPESAFGFLKSIPLLAYLHAAEPGVATAPPDKDWDIGLSLDLMAEAGIRYIVMDRQFVTDARIAAWEGWFALPPIHRDQDVVVFATEWRQQAAEIQAPVLSHGERVLNYGLEPRSTVPAGWVEAHVSWTTPGDAPHVLCLEVVSPDQRIVSETCDLQVRDAETQQHGSSSLLRAGSLVQIPADADTGTFRLCLRAPTQEDGSGGASGGRRSRPVCRPVRVVREYSAPSVEMAVGEDLGQSITLFGFDVLEVTADALALRMIWFARNDPGRSYKMFLHVTAPSTGELAAQADYIPRTWTYPTDIWLGGEYIDDEVSIDISSLEPGVYDVFAGIYDPESGARLKTPQGEDAIWLMPLWRHDAVIRQPQ